MRVRVLNDNMTRDVKSSCPFSARLLVAVLGAVPVMLAHADNAMPVTASTPMAHAAARASSMPEFDRERLSADARVMADWVARSHDNGREPFLMVDKKNARLLAFDADGHLVATSTILLGYARGDDTVPGVGEKKLADIKPFERTTPAGRFVAEEGRNLQNEQIIWIDYDAAVSMHRVRTTNARERRLQRLASSRVEDKRISWGCVNVPAAFFDAHVAPIFRDGRRAVIYVLPEVRTLAEVFPGYGASAGARPNASPARAGAPARRPA